MDFALLITVILFTLSEIIIVTDVLVYVLLIIGILSVVGYLVGYRSIKQLFIINIAVLSMAFIMDKYIVHPGIPGYLYTLGHLLGVNFIGAWLSEKLGDK